MHKAVQVCLSQLLSNASAAGVPRNAVVSPVSLRAAVAMLGLGCSGRSLDQILRFFEVEQSVELKERFIRPTAVMKRAQIPFANGAWIDKRRLFTPSYEQLLRDDFKAQVKTLDFVNQGDELVRDMNSWVDNHTNGLIKSMVSGVDPSAAVILGNALHFKGTCKIESNVASSDFYLEDGEKVSDVVFMNSFSKEWKLYSHGSFDGYSAAEIPFENRLAMRLFLPDKTDGLKDMLEKINEVPKLLDSELNDYGDFEFSIPKLKFSYAIENIDLGSETVDLGEMLQPAESGGEGVIQMIQKLRFEVEDKVTEVPYTLGHPSRKLFKFVAAHPFMFTVKDTLTNLVIFMGTVRNPLKGKED